MTYASLYASHVCIWVVCLYASPTLAVKKIFSIVRVVFFACYHGCCSRRWWASCYNLPTRSYMLSFSDLVQHEMVGFVAMPICTLECLTWIYLFCTDRPEGVEIKKQGIEIGKAMAEKSKGLFSADDWQCKSYVFQFGQLSGDIRVLSTGNRNNSCMLL